MKKFTAVGICALLLIALPAQVFAQRSPSPDKTFHNLIIITMPADAVVAIDGQRIQGNSIQVSEGQHTVTVSRQGYADWSRTVTITKNTMMTANLQRARTFSLSVTANVKDAQVFVDNTLIGTAPANTVRDQGMYAIRVTAPGYTDYSATVNLSENQTVNAVLQPATAMVTLNVPGHVKRMDRDFRVFVDGRPVNDVKFPVLPGAHTIRIAGGSFTLEQEFFFQAGRNYEIDLVIGMMIR